MSLTIDQMACVKDDDSGGRNLLLGNLMRILRPGPTLPSVRWINRDLAIGCPAEDAGWQAMRARGVRGVVDLSDASGDLGPLVRRHGMRYLRLPVEDGRLPHAEELHIVTSWLWQRVYEDGPVLVHEAEGRGNHAVVACAALIKRGASVRRAGQQLKHASRAPLTDVQLDLLERFAVEMTVASGRD